MTFKTAGEAPQEYNGDGTGLPMKWYNLHEGACPKCGDMLISFEHLDLFKCTCGFKISASRMREILDSMDEDDGGGSIARGYMFGDYQDEPPF